MQTKKLLLSIFKEIRRPLAGKGLGDLPIIKQTINFLYQCLKPFDGIGLIELPDYKIYINSNDDVGSSLIKGERWEPYFTEVIKKEIKKGMTIVDLGAFWGFHTLYMAKLVGPEGKVFAFEPDPYNYNLLLKSIEANGYNNVIAVQKAVSDKVGKTKLFLDRDIPYRHTIYDPGNGRESIEVETTTLDEFFKNTNNKIDIIKMDIEGAEMAALRGMQKILKKNSKIKIFTEFNPKHLERAGCFPEDFLKELINCGFKLFNINDEKKKIELVNIREWTKLYENREGTNLLCVKD
jgi:FkbM family methyltransferase